MRQLLCVRELFVLTNVAEFRTYKYVAARYLPDRFLALTRHETIDNRNFTNLLITFIGQIYYCIELIVPN